MRARAAVAFTLLAALAMLQLGCAVRSAPRGWLPYAHEAQREAYGGWLEMSVGEADAPRIVQGELLAIFEQVRSGVFGVGRQQAALARCRNLQDGDPSEAELRSWLEDISATDSQ